MTTKRTREGKGEVRSAEYEEVIGDCQTCQMSNPIKSMGKERSEEYEEVVGKCQPRNSTLKLNSRWASTGDVKRRCINPTSDPETEPEPDPASDPDPELQIEWLWPADFEQVVSRHPGSKILLAVS